MTQKKNTAPKKSTGTKKSGTRTISFNQEARKYWKGKKDKPDMII